MARKERFINKVVFIAPTSSQPRYHKRVRQFSKFCHVEVFAFSRGLYEKNIFPKEIHITFLGYLANRKYLNRIFKIIPAIFKVRKKIRHKKRCLFYALSFDCMLIARLSGLKHGFYEISDLRQTEGFGKIVPFFEKFILRNILGLVLTSRFFYEDFYKDKGFISKDRVFVIENKVNPILRINRPSYKKFSHGRIIIGLLGYLRYKRSTELLLNFVKKWPDFFEIECYGDGPLLGLIKSYTCENIRYHGSFKNPEDLPKIYAQIDLNYVVYDNQYKNVRLLIPNKLYESAFFGVPIVCSHRTLLGEEVERWKIGKMIRTDCPEHFEEDLGLINKEWLTYCSKSCFRIPNSELLDNGEKIVQEMLEHVEMRW